MSTPFWEKVLRDAGLPVKRAPLPEILMTLGCVERTRFSQPGPRLKPRRSTEMPGGRMGWLEKPLPAEVEDHMDIFENSLCPKHCRDKMEVDVSYFCVPL